MKNNSTENCNDYIGKFGYVHIQSVTSGTHGLPSWTHPSTGSKDIWGFLICLMDIQLLNCSTGNSAYMWKRTVNGTWAAL